jgi:hypothetical protein
VGQRGHGKGRGLHFFSMKKERKIINWEQDLFTPQNSVSS